MTARESEFIGRLQVEVGAVGCREGHGLAEVMIEIVVKFVLSVLSATAEDIYIISAFVRGLDDSVGAQLVALRLRFNK